MNSHSIFVGEVSVLEMLARTAMDDAGTNAELDSMMAVPNPQPVPPPNCRPEPRMITSNVKETARVR